MISLLAKAKRALASLAKRAMRLIMPAKRAPSRAPIELRASSSQRWLYCQASPHLEKLARDQGMSQEGEPKEAAERGTVLHQAIEYAVSNSGHLPGLPSEDREAVGIALAASIEWRSKYQLVAAERSMAVGAMRGTVDYVGKDIDGQGYHGILDWKFGRLPVVARNNIQLLCYAYMAATQGKWKPTDVVSLAICQPLSLGEVFTEWIMTVQELKSRARRIAAVAARLAEGVVGPALPHSSRCAYCDALLCCPSAHEYVSSSIPYASDMTMTEKLDRPPLGELRDKSQLAATLAARIDSYILNHPERAKREGLAVQEGKPGARAWRDQKEVEELLEGHIAAFETKLLSPTQLAKRDPDSYAIVEGLVNRPKGKPKVIPIAKEEDIHE